MSRSALSVAFLSVALGACSSESTAPAARSEGTGGAAAGSGGSGATSSDGGTGGAEPAREWGADHCPAPSGPLGYSVGDSLGALEVVDCDTGEARSIDELCGAAATWVFVAHSHCPTCRATARFTYDVAQRFAREDVAIAHVFFDDSGVDCPSWRETHALAGLSNVRVYQDPTGRAWERIKTANVTAPSLILDAQRTVRHQQHGMSAAEVTQEIERVLAP